MAMSARVTALIAVVAADHHMPPERLKFSSDYKAAAARFDCWWRLRHLIPNPPGYCQIARWFDKNHSTVYYGVSRWDRHVEDNMPLLRSMAA